MADNTLGLSDEEFLKQDPAAFLSDPVEEAPAEGSDTEPEATAASEASEEEEAEAEPTEPEASDDAEGEGAASEEAVASEAQEEPAGSSEEEEVGQPNGDTQTELETEAEGDKSESLDTSGKPADTKGDTPETDKVDYKSAYERITQPFKANGVEMKVSDPDDIVKLMQMGANYQKKMAQLKPHLKMVKMLEKNDLLDEDRLNRLIDLSRKDPKAIAQLVKESGIDPLDMDSDKAGEYQPGNHSVSDKEFDLDQVLESIKESPKFSTTIKVLTEDWDAKSRSTISENPEIISVINMHMENGVFDKVNEVLVREKALGKLNGIPDVEAYRQIAEHLATTGVLRTQGATQETAQKAEADVSSEPDTSTNAAADDRKNRRRAVAPVQQTSTAKEKTPDNFLGLSDADFMKKFAAG